MQLKSLIIEYRAAATAAIVAGLVAVVVTGGVGRDEVRVHQTSADASASQQESSTTAAAPTSSSTTAQLPTLEELPARVVVVEKQVADVEKRVTAIESTTTTTSPPYNPPPAPTPIAAPGNVTVTRGDDGLLHVRWDAVEGAVRYVVTAQTYTQPADFPCCEAALNVQSGDAWIWVEAFPSPDDRTHYRGLAQVRFQGAYGGTTTTSTTTSTTVLAGS